MTQRVRFIERLRKELHEVVDVIVDSFYKPSFQETKSLISSLKVALDRLQNQIKEDD